ncbi:MAG: GNAT family N-acetyltransferase [Dehalococcoidia bacterium]|nr:GNAT family N-acetyltransferase [Dehalococcoidia bacterium]
MTAGGRVWARFGPVALVSTAGVDLGAAPGLRRALADGIERGYSGEVPAAPAGAKCFLLRVDGETVGVFTLVRGVPGSSKATAYAVAIDPAHRGHSYGVQALLGAERRLAGEGCELFTRVPRTNGRGLYFMLRAGFVPVPPEAGHDADDVTWFRRGSRAGAVG